LWWPAAPAGLGKKPWLNHMHVRTFIASAINVLATTRHID
jgi:hypothetical protein